MSVIKVGLVGVGAQMQENLLPSLLQMPDVRIVAACDIDETRATQMRRFIPDIPTTNSVAAMLDATAVDALVMACPPSVHRDAGLIAMRRGVSVFVEKPPCGSLQELELLVATAREFGVTTGVGMNFRFARPVRQLQEMTTAEAFGNTLHIQLNHYASKPRARLWGLDSTLRSFLLAQAIHTIDLAVMFGRGALTDVRSRVQRHGDTLLVNGELTFSSGATASVLAGTMFPYFEFEMRLIGSSSTMVELDNLWKMTVHEPEHGTRATGAGKRWRGAWQPGPLDSGYERSGYTCELHAFFDALRTRNCFEADFKSLLPTYRIIEAICEANEPSDAARCGALFRARGAATIDGERKPLSA